MEKRLIGHESRGRSHFEDGSPCQDKTFTMTIGEVSCVALADGAGSAKLSHIGAEIITKAAATLLCGHFDQYINGDGKQFVLSVCDTIRNEIDSYALSHNCDPKELASTLLLLAANDEFFIALHLGDGVIVGVKNGHAYAISTPDNGEFTNSTFFTTSSNLESKIRVYKGRVDGYSGFALMSDGTAESFYLKRTGEVSQGIKRIVEGVATVGLDLIKTNIIRAFDNIITQKTKDDCSIAVLSFYKNVSSYDFKKQCEILGIPYASYRARQLVDSYNQIIQFVQDNPKTHHRNFLKTKTVGTFCKKNGISRRALRRRIIRLKSKGLINSS